MNHSKKITTPNQAGFTIVELMIATMVFSSIILVVTFGVLQFSKAYYRGVTTATTQNAARNVIDSVTQAIQYSGGSLTTNTTSAPLKTVCVGNSQFDYRLSTKRLASSHVLYISPNSTSACTTLTSFNPAVSRELLDPNMRLAKFNVSLVPGTTTLYNVSVRVVYGDDDLLCSPSQAGDCTTGGTSTYLGNDDLVCKIAAGSQFCAASELSTTIQKRIN